ncbi:hypothetical protein GCM10027299_44290 [Larkinella ripae]
MIDSLRVLLLRRFNQAFWLLMLMMLSGWGAWRFCRQAVLAPSLASPAAPARPEIHQFHLQSIAALDSSVTLLRLAVRDGQSETTLLALNEQIRQQTQEVSLLSSGGRATVLTPKLLNSCLAFRQLILQKTAAPRLSQHLATWQSEIRHLYFQSATLP